MTSSESDHHASSARDTIARSMSRYRGKRQASQTNIPPIPKVGLANPLQHSRNSSQPAVFPQGQSPGRNISTIRCDLAARDSNPKGETVGSRTPSAPSASNLEVRDIVRKSAKQVGDAQGTSTAHRLRSAQNSQTTPNSQAKVEAHAVLGNAVGPKTQQEQDVHRSSTRGGGPKIRDELRKRSMEKLVEPAEGPTDSHHQVGRSGAESRQKLVKSDKRTGPSPIRVPLPKKSFGERMADHITKYQPSGRSSSKADLKSMISTPIAMAPGGELTSPSFDAPISAVNAGERRVIVQCKDSLIYLPVTPSTTPLDIINATALQHHHVNVKTSVLLESFKKVGLQRPLRKYEHIRDVLNSWDNDAQNTLIIVPSPTGGIDDDLEAKAVSKDQPGETSVYLYHSQKPGRWDKRWVILRSDGQVVLKRPGKDSANICHLSDFDIYVPTPRQLAKKIKPPKKLCFAVKSQQKSSMFLSTDNFVHFFSTSDKTIATTWYKAVQQWRSWYLVNIMGEGQTTTKTAPNDNPKNSKELAKAIDVSKELHIQSPAIQDSVFNRKDTIRLNGSYPGGRRQGTSQGQDNERLASPSAGQIKSAPPISFPKKFLQDVKFDAPSTRFQGLSTRNTEQEPFSSTGLLGRTYSQRQKTQHDGLRDSSPHTGSNHKAMPSQGHEENPGLKRGSSQRLKPKPLVDLTPQYQEPPQHLKKGRGVIPQQIPAGGLVDIATSPDVAIPIPPTKTWRRPGTSSGDSLPGQQPNSMQSPIHAEFKKDPFSG